MENQILSELLMVLNKNDKNLFNHTSDFIKNSQNHLLLINSIEVLQQQVALSCLNLPLAKSSDIINIITLVESNSLLCEIWRIYILNINYSELNQSLSKTDIINIQKKLLSLISL